MLKIIIRKEIRFYNGYRMIKMKISDYTVPELEHFRELCNFSEEELEYFNLKSKDKSNIQISLSMCISEPKVSKIAAKVKDKIRRIEMYDNTSTVL